MNRSSKFSEGYSVHLLFFGLFALLAAGYLFDVLFQEKHLSAFDFILEKPAWSVEFGSTSVAKGVLADSPTAHYPYKKIFWESLRSGSNTDYLPHILTGQPTTSQGTGIFATSFFQLFMDVPNALDRVFCATRQVINPETLGVPEQLSELVHHEDRPVIVQRELVAGKELTKKCLVSDLNVYMSQIDFAVTSDEPTLIFIPVNYHPNWSATLNEEVAVIHRGNFAFMVIQVPVGTSHITLSYTDTKLVIGAIGLILLGMLSLLYALTSSKPKWHKALLIVCGLLLVGKNSLSVPGIKNTTIPERAIEQSLDTSRATREG